MDTTKLCCPLCGKTYKTNASPAKPEDCSCNDNSAIYRAESTPPAAAKAQESAVWEEFFKMAVDNLPEKLSCVSGINEKTAKALYPRALNDFYYKMLKSFDYFNAAYSACGTNKSGLISRYAFIIAQKIRIGTVKLKSADLKHTKYENVIILYLAFLIPSVMKYETEYSNRLADALLVAWRGRMPLKPTKLRL